MNLQHILSFSSDELHEWALEKDRRDALGHFRERFYLPQRDGETLTYLCGNSLGLQPKATREAIDRELTTWQNHGVEGWFEGEESWLSYHRYCQKSLAAIVGALPEEVCPMNHLTVNLHLMWASFYQPTAERYKVLTVAGDFPSDQYALETHLRFRGYDPAVALIEVVPRKGEYSIRTADILDTIAQHADELALICMSGLHYYTGQVYDMQAITAFAHRHGLLVGFDLAHAAGNIPLQLHNWGVDFAVWCSYKYLNSGPGGVSGLFVHEKHHTASLPRLAGWWGYEEARRFEMTKGFVPMQGAAGWQLSTPNIMALAMHRASLAIFEEAGIENLRRKSEELTGLLEMVLQRINQKAGMPKIQLMTPTDPAQRGAQLSLLIENEGKKVFDALTAKGIIGDWREPNCIRLTPIPLYTAFEDIWKVGEALENYWKL
ncbi:kynureninase [Runella slithyformis]|uniref:Kynureninase n=1 Tax=Runella slithyformis (strain ATCC 29530 / DSM 19594 / LMG 11500 / NCIMB 11436 / LSU 4) TaxID=761193 RepID=A0A7U3ZJQ2_RUNSL|nr:kynureninase [Runella slithyformis]AEI48428.1 kynureninase [Runella slithyformis DSM 19594]